MEIQTILTKENSKILRGLGITAIMLHNFLTIPQFALSRCNEMSFSLEKSMAFFNTFGNGHVIAEIIAFLGWIGVPVFVFLTGYGVASSFHPSFTSERINLIKKNWLKLFLLLLPMLVVLGIHDILQHDYCTFFKRLLYPTFMVNLAYPYLKVVPYVYWYFGLTFQYYLLWTFVGRYCNKSYLFYGSLLAIVGLYFLCMSDLPKVTSIYKHCFTGWFFIFALGIYMSIDKNNFIGKFSTTWWQEFLLSVFYFSMVLVMHLSLESWLFVPIVAIFFFLTIGKLVMRVGLLRKVFLWVGNLSAFIFVCHPLAKSIVSRIGFRYTDNMSVLVFIFMVLTIFLSILYKGLNQYLMTLCYKRK